MFYSDWPLDSVDIAGHDTTLGYSRNADFPVNASSAIVRLLRDAGAFIHVKTTVPTGLLGLETKSDLFGRTTNPYDKERTVGATTGGGAALLACGGSKIEVGSDIGGSLRIPAHFCGIWGLKGSVGRFPTWGVRSGMPGLEGIETVAGSMAGSLDDLEEFWKRVVMAEPWRYDHTVGVSYFIDSCYNQRLLSISVSQYLGSRLTFEKKEGDWNGV